MKKQNKLALAIALALTTGSLPVAQASSTTTVSSGGQDFFEITFFDQGEGCEDFGISTYTLSDYLKQGITQAVQYWSDILAPGLKNTSPVQVFVRTFNDHSANAYQWNYIANQDVAMDYWTQALQQGRTLNHLSDNDTEWPSDASFAWINVGKYLGIDRSSGTEYGWMYDVDSILPTNEQSGDLQAVFRHEMLHAFGVYASRERMISGMDDAGNLLRTFSKEYLNPWTQHLVDQNGNKAQPGMLIVTSDHFNKLQAQDPSLKASDYFIVDDSGEGVTTPKANIPTSGKAYFIGSHVSEVLDGATFDGVDGLPVNGWESKQPELSHLTTNTLMSHSHYRTSLVFTEAELAALQDIGYVFDRKKYYGYSLYRDHAVVTNTTGYSERNAEGTAYQNNVYSTVPLGIGLHVYGSYNDITQAADILTAGRGSIGMRVEGDGNHLTLAAGHAVHADGYRGMGTLISYGANQVFDQYGTVTANGTGGTGVQFDFGSNSYGLNDYRGSYLRYQRTNDKDTGRLKSAENLSFAYHDGIFLLATPELNGPLVSAYNLYGSLSGAANAIYISKNAFVQDINVLPGASINGAITSEWKHFNTDGSYDGVNGDGSDALKIRYKDTLYAYDSYIPDLVTNLNFNTNLAYGGNITGSDNMKLKVNGGTLLYGGTANVVNVNVTSGAVLAGGTYTVNDMTGKMAAGFSDTTTGQFINHGTIMPGAENMTINGNLVSDGSIGLMTTDAQTARQIVVSGTANIAGSRLIAVEGNAYLPGKSYTFLQAGSIQGSLANTAGSAFSGLLSLKNLESSGTTLGASFAAENHLGTLNGAEQAAFALLPQLAANTASDSAKQAQLGQLYSAPAAAAKQALHSVTGNLAPDASALVVSNMTAMNAIGARLGYLATDSALTGTSKARADEDTTKEARIIPIDMGATSSGWLKFSKSWESLGRDATSGHGSAISIGFDHKVNADWRVGEFFTYGKNSFSAGASNLDNTDYRLGVYGMREKGPQQTFVYFDIGRQTNDSKRYISAAGNYLANSSYKSRTIELGARYSYDLDYAKEGGWHKKPYAEAQIVHYRQDGYTEGDAGVWNQTVKSENTTYSAVTLGMSMEKKNADSDVELRAGYKRVLSGNDPSYRVHFTDAAEQGFTVHGSSLDKNLIVLGVHAGQEMGSDWRLEGDLQLEKGSTEKNLQASVMVKKSW